MEIRGPNQHGQTPSANKPDPYSRELHEMKMSVESVATDIIEDLPNYLASAQTSHISKKRKVTWETGNKAGGDTYLAAQKVFTNKSVLSQAPLWSPHKKHRAH